MVDLHSHTTASDGQHTPTELIQMAAQAGIKHLAVTDHDTVAGLAEAATAAEARGLELVPGIELSAFLNGREVHILGHFIRAADAELLRLAERFRSERYQRMKQMVEKMNQLGIPITMARVMALAGEANLGRPHLARALIEERICATVKEAFDRFLAHGKPAFVERTRVAAEEAIQMIRNAGGAATVAHPGVSRVTDIELKALESAGLAGLEVFHSDHKPPIQQKYLAIARDLDLVPTAGSDFHGEQVAPGRRLGTASMAMADFEELRRRAAA
jgi:predicted metal-dependent phosphoesterase TrpH